MPQPTLSPNLLPKHSFEELPLWEKLIIFLGSYGRHIIILCQLLVVLAFGWRFILDEQLNRINQKIDTQVATVKSLASVETTWRQTQTTLGLIKQIRASNLALPEVLDTFVAQLPSDIAPSSISVKKGGLELVAKTSNLGALAKLVINLKQLAEFKEIYLTSAKLDPLNQTFTVQINVVL